MRAIAAETGLSSSKVQRIIGDTRAKAAAWETVSASPGDRVGLIVFGGSAFLQLPLTSDHAALKLLAERVALHELPDGGHYFLRTRPTEVAQAVVRTAPLTYERRVA